MAVQLIYKGAHIYDYVYCLVLLLLLLTVHFLDLWWLTTPPPAYSWQKPPAWSSSRLYPWGSDNGDQDFLDYQSDDWKQYFMCHKIRLNGKVGAPFFNKRHNFIHVSEHHLLLLLYPIIHSV